MKLPIELTSRPRWVRWSAKKVPLTVAGPAASSTDPTTWSDYRTASASTVGEGVGFVLNGDGIVCVDLDHCLIDGVLLPWAQAILDRFPPTYTEVSPSGEGLHVWGFGLVGRGRRTGRVEVYGSGRYITVTGDRFGACRELADLSAVLDEVR